MQGIVRGDGTIDGNVTNNGLVAPGTSSGILHIEGNYEQNAAGELSIELASASSYDQLQVTDNATLDGTLTVNLTNGFLPSAGQSFNILDWGSLAGTFSSLACRPVRAWPGIRTSSTPLGCWPWSPPGVHGDYNDDDVVDAADYVMWRKLNGTSTVMPNDSIRCRLMAINM